MAWNRARDIGRRMLDLRVRGLRMTQEEEAELFGVTVGTVSEWERGESRPARNTLVRIAKLLGIPDTAFQEGGELPATLPRMPQERRSPGEGTPGYPERASLKAQRQIEAEAKAALLRAAAQGQPILELALGYLTRMVAAGETTPPSIGSDEPGSGGR